MEPGNEASTYRTVPPDFSILFLSSNCKKKMTEEGEDREGRRIEKEGEGRNREGKTLGKDEGQRKAKKEKIRG